MSLHEPTLQYIYKLLRQNGESGAAVLVADHLIEQTPGNWAEHHQDEYTDQTTFVKALRSEFDLSLKEAKKISDEVWEEPVYFTRSDPQ